MKCNVGGIDRKLRILIGLVIIAVGIYFQSWWGVIGAVPLLTGAFSWCPAYSLFGMSTLNGCCPTRKKSTTD